MRAATVRPKEINGRFAMTVRACAAALLLLVAAGAAPAGAQQYPDRPIKLIVPFPAGGTLDVAARVIGDQLAQQMGQAVVIDNRGAANGIPGTDAVAKAPADGYTLLIVTASFVVNPLVHKKLPYDVEKDFAPITDTARGTGYMLVVPASLKIGSIAEFVKASNAPDAHWHFSSPGHGNTLHLAAEMFALKTGAKVAHVPYRGVAPAVTAVLAGEVQLSVMPPLAALEQAKSGAIKVLAYTGTQRAAELPDVPTVTEAGFPDLVMEGAWHGMFVAAGTPQPIIDRIYAEMRKALAAPRVAETLKKGGYDSGGMPPAEFARFLKEETARYGEMVKAAKIEAK
jgi:tripartite-type tricarboxylate transporter receptor subunit TctC